TNYTLTYTAVTNNTCPRVVTITWQVADCVGYTTTCSYKVTLVDTVPPIITCPTNKTVFCGTTWSFDTPTATDACCGTNVTILLLGTLTNGNCPQVISRIWQAVDCCTNYSLTCTQRITVIDTNPPILTCPTNKTVACGSTWTFDSPVATDT